MRRTSKDPLLLGLAALLLLVGTIGGLGAVSQWGEPFPGFLVLENRVVPSVGLSVWPATAGGEIYQHQVVAVGGRDVASADEIREVVAQVPIGTEIEYRFQRGEQVLVRRIATRQIEGRDLVLLYGPYALNGVVLGLVALLALRYRHRNPAAPSAVALFAFGSLFTLTALDLYGPYRLFRLHALCEAMLWPAAIHLALGFPHPARCLERRPWLPAAAYSLAAVGALVYQIGLDQAASYVSTHLLAVTAFGAGLLALVLSEVERFRRPASLDVRERVRVIAVGAILACALPISLTLAELLTGGRSPQNAVALTTVVFPLAVAYALWREDFPKPLGVSAPG